MNELSTGFKAAKIGQPLQKVEALNFIRANHFVLFDGTETLIEDFSPHLSYDSALLDETHHFKTPPNTPDQVKVKIAGEWHDFDETRFKRIPVPEGYDLPENFVNGARIRMHGCDDTIRNIYLLKTPENQAGRVTFDCNVFVNCEYNPRKVHIFMRDGARGYAPNTPKA